MHKNKNGIQTHYVLLKFTSVRIDTCHSWRVSFSASYFSKININTFELFECLYLQMHNRRDVNAATVLGLLRERESFLVPKEMCRL